MIWLSCCQLSNACDVSKKHKNSYLTLSTICHHYNNQRANADTKTITAYFENHTKDTPTNCVGREQLIRIFTLESVQRQTYHLAATFGQAINAASCLPWRHDQDVGPMHPPAHWRDGSLQFVVSEMDSLCQSHIYGAVGSHLWSAVPS